MPPTKKKSKDVAKIAAPKPAASKVSIDYPKEGEEVSPGHYAVRVSAQGADGVEISINDGPWQPCRAAVGFHWFDWTPSTPGPHVIAVRSRKGGARGKAAVLRTCSVRQSALN